jgi:hypothetical protein
MNDEFVPVCGFQYYMHGLMFPSTWLLYNVKGSSKRSLDQDLPVP